MAKGIIERTPQIIAAKINRIKIKPPKYCFTAPAEIRRRPATEAKSMVNHGEMNGENELENSVRP